MKILVTGGCGFIGTNLIRHLLQHTEHHVVNVDKLTYAACPESLDDLADSSRYRLVPIDLANGEAIEQTLGESRPDAVMHLAAESHVDRSIDGAADFIQSNIVGTYQLLEACRRFHQTLPDQEAERFRFLQVSTDEVYGSLGAQGSFKEDTAYAPRSPYAASKASADHLARAWRETYRLPVVVTNASNNFGPYQFPEKLIPLMIVKAVREEPLPVYGAGLNVRDWLYVDDHVNALLTVLSRGEIGQTYNIGGDNQQRNIDVVRTLCRILDELRPRPCGKSYTELVTHVDDRPGHDFRYAIDAGKMKRELNWKPQHPWQSSLKQTVQWYLDNPAWWQRILDGKYGLQRLGTRDAT